MRYIARYTPIVVTLLLITSLIHGMKTSPPPHAPQLISSMHAENTELAQIAIPSAGRAHRILRVCSHRPLRHQPYRYIVTNHTPEPWRYQPSVTIPHGNLAEACLSMCGRVIAFFVDGTGLIQPPHCRPNPLSVVLRVDDLFTSDTPQPIFICMHSTTTADRSTLVGRSFINHTGITAPQNHDTALLVSEKVDALGNLAYRLISFSAQLSPTLSPPYMTSILEPERCLAIDRLLGIAPAPPQKSAVHTTTCAAKATGLYNLAAACAISNTRRKRLLSELQQGLRREEARHHDRPKKKKKVRS